MSKTLINSENEQIQSFIETHDRLVKQAIADYNEGIISIAQVSNRILGVNRAYQERMNYLNSQIESFDTNA